MFGDIVGFTHWASSREPSDVFTFLETVYGEFDKLGECTKVFIPSFAALTMTCDCST